MVISPPHTICDTITAEITSTLPGLTKPLKVKKQTHPAKILSALESCYIGRSSGACYDYFQILKGLARHVHSAATECRSKVFAIPDIKSRISEGIENLVLLAWGDFPPESPNERFGILQEADISLFCYLKSAYVFGSNESSWNELRKKMAKKLPGEKVKLPDDPKAGLATPRPASEVLSELEIWNKSLFSIRCENYL